MGRYDYYHNFLSEVRAAAECHDKRCSPEYKGIHDEMLWACERLIAQLSQSGDADATAAILAYFGENDVNKVYEFVLGE